jgi:7-keto-8-aminopelargonate synthetase-like enzyme
VYRHGDAAHVDELLSATTAGRALVVSESVFSMDGDVAPIDDLIDVCARRGALLVLDEAHTVIGPDPGSIPGDVLRVGTLSKTLGALGGFVAGPTRFTDLLVNQARSYIFTTASTPADRQPRWRRSPWCDRPRATTCARLRGHVERLRPVIRHPSFRTSAATSSRRSTPRGALDEGFLVTAIRPPTVPPGTSRSA